MKIFIPAAAAFLSFLTWHVFPEASAIAGSRVMGLDPEDPQETVFIPLLDSEDGAPSREGLDLYVILTDLIETDPYWDVVEFLKTQGASEVIQFRHEAMDRAFQRLAELKPGFVAVAVRPDLLDVNFHFDFLERASRLDKDPFVDFAFGYVTGATPLEAFEFVEGIAAAKRMKIPKTILEFGPTEKPYDSRNPHKWAKGFYVQRFGHEEKGADVIARLKKLTKTGILKAWGHGEPDGVTNGLKGKEIRKSGLDLHPALYFSGPCWCGVPSGWYTLEGGGVKRKVVDPMDSFLLALIKAKASAVFAGIDPDRGETNHHECEYLLVTGDPVGMASKSTYDEVVVAYRRPRLQLPQYEEGKGKPHRDIADTMISGGACRALFGDPTFRPFGKAGDDPFRVKTKWSKKGLEVLWKGDSNLGKYWSPVDIFRAEGRWTHRIRFRIEQPLDRAREIRGFRVLSVTKDGKEVPYVFPSAAVESWGGKARIHGMVVFPGNEKDRVLWGGKEYKARFLFSKAP